MTPVRAWAIALAAGVLAAAADVVTHAAHLPHLVASAAAALLFYGAGSLGRDLRAAAGGAVLHALLDGLWLVHLFGVHAGLSYAFVAAAFNLTIDLLAAQLGARRAARFR